MKKYIFNLGVVASLVAGGISVASATPTNGTVNVAGSLQASTCSVSMTPSSIEIPALTVTDINNKGDNSELTHVNGPKFTLTGCDGPKRVYMNLINGSPASPDAGNVGLFTFDGGKPSVGSPIYFKYFPNQLADNGSGGLDLAGNGKQAINGDSSPLIRIYKRTEYKGNASTYSGGYNTTLTVNYEYN
ncbi:hypothetical protein K0K19_002634 [Salmonella enterica]|nr:hypothetical protein [Salmonella enterica subsp. enterica serovar Waycross]EHV3412805.1 hypothetical protein [Salmonella enterica]